MSLSTAERGSMSIDGGTDATTEDVGLTVSADKASIPWEVNLPKGFLVVKKLIQSPTLVKAAFVVYFITTIGLIVFYAARLDRDIRAGIANGDILHYALDRFQDIAYLLMPYLTYFYFQSFFSDADVPLLFSGAIAIQPKLKMMFIVLFRVNITFVTASFVVYAVYADSALEQAVLCFYSGLYLYPFCFIYSLSVCIMLAHRAHAMAICDLAKISRASLDDMMHISMPRHLQINDEPLLSSQLRSDSAEQHSIGIYEIYTKYRVLHAMCLKTSEKRGPYILLMYMLAMMFGLTTVWNIYVGEQELYASAGYFCITVFIILQLGLSVTAANEAGHIACRELSTFVVSQPEFFQAGADGRNGNHAAMLLIGCMNYAKLEVLFFGNFALRSRHLVAIIGTLVGSLIPALVFGGS